MKIFSKIIERYYYYWDNFRARQINTKIDHFIYDKAHHTMMVSYRLGRQKLLHKMAIFQFEQEFFDKVSGYDRHRLIKFSTLQHVLVEVFKQASCSESDFQRYIQEEIKNEQLF